MPEKLKKLIGMVVLIYTMGFVSCAGFVESVRGDRSPTGVERLSSD